MNRVSCMYSSALFRSCLYPSSYYHNHHIAIHYSKDLRVQMSRARSYRYPPFLSKALFDQYPAYRRAIVGRVPDEQGEFRERSPRVSAS